MADKAAVKELVHLIRSEKWQLTESTARFSVSKISKLQDEQGILKLKEALRYLNHAKDLVKDVVEESLKVS